MLKKIPCFFVLILIAKFSIAQTTHSFTDGLIVPLDLKYGREALVMDPLAYQLFEGSFKVPGEGSKLFQSTNGEASEWKSISTDSTGNFKGDDLSGGYLYLHYDAEEERTALLNISGHNMVFFNGVPHGGDIYKYRWLYAPVTLKKGRNDILVRCSRWARWQGIGAKLVFPEKPVMLQTDDATLPHIVVGQENEKLLGAVVVINTTKKSLENLTITSRLQGSEVTLPLPSIPSMTSRKVAFHFDAGNITKKGSYNCSIQLKEGTKLLDTQEISVEAVNPEDHYSNTFISNIDGSVQYYSVAPQLQGGPESPALFLSVHGAEVQAIGQARAYDPKDWGILVAPTNRRPRGFNWEEWGMMDALEVLEIAKKKFNPDPKKIYLTGHSMGGHGTWYLGATFPDKWAAIGPCAGYPSLSVYGSADGKIPDSSKLGAENMLVQASSPSDVIGLIKNYSSAGIYIHHGDSDKVVSVDYARQMRKLLGEFHKDFSYYEYPGGSHWFGDESVDWPPMFEYFKWHTIPDDSAVNVVDFTTANTGISSKYYWVDVLQQQKSLLFSNIKLRRSLSEKSITGATENIAALSFSLKNFAKGDTITISLDDEAPLHYVCQSSDDKIYLRMSDKWEIVNEFASRQKGTVRNGTFKEPFNHRMVFVYGTGGNVEENKWAYEKAVYDAEVWYYRGNGAVDIIADKSFNPSKYPDRGVILFGNAKTNRAWKKLLSDCPVQVQPGTISVGDKKYTGDDLGAYFMWPRADSEIASVAVVSGTGIKGMNATESNQYFAAGSGFPDFMVFSLDMLKDGANGIKCAGFYTNDWKVDTNNSAFE